MQKGEPIAQMAKCTAVSDIKGGAWRCQSLCYLARKPDVRMSEEAASLQNAGATAVGRHASAAQEEKVPQGSKTIRPTKSIAP